MAFRRLACFPIGRKSETERANTSHRPSNDVADWSLMRALFALRPMGEAKTSPPNAMRTIAPLARNNPWSSLNYSSRLRPVGRSGSGIFKWLVANREKIFRYAFILQFRGNSVFWLAYATGKTQATLLLRSRTATGPSSLSFPSVNTKRRLPASYIQEEPHTT